MSIRSNLMLNERHTKSGLGIALRRSIATVAHQPRRYSFTKVIVYDVLYVEGTYIENAPDALKHTHRISRGMCCENLW